MQSFSPEQRSLLFLPFSIQVFFPQCFGLMLTSSCQTLTSSYCLTSSHQQVGRLEELDEKSSWGEVKTGRLVTNYHHRQDRLDFEKNSLIYLPVKSDLGDGQQSKNQNTFLSPPTLFPRLIYFIDVKSLFECK